MSIAPGIPRRHDLDALRAFAMLLGIVLHVALSLSGIPWIVQDRYPNPVYGIVNAAIHGFRMPLFFLISGFFTAMLWRRRGLKALLRQRFQRVFIPCMLGLVTVIPAFRWAATWSGELAARQDARRRISQGARSELVESIRQHDLAGLDQLLAGGANPNQVDPEFGIPPLSWAAMYGDTSAARRLIERGANVNATDESGYRPLHSAAFLGHVEVANLLLEHGADPNARGRRFDSARDSAGADQGTTRAITTALRIPFRPEDELQAGRAECRQRLAKLTGETDTPRTGPAPSWWSLDSLRRRYVGMITSDRFLVRWSRQGEPFHLFLTSLFDYLWFLWFLCWLVVAFAACAAAAERVRMPSLPRWVVLSSYRWLWLVPITMIPQVLMGGFAPEFGPDTSTGVLPQPHVLLYYGVFFAFGTFYFDCDDYNGQLGRRWWLTLPLAVLVLFPFGLVTVGSTVLSGLAQVTYAWAMTFGLMGLSRRLLTRENRTIRYLSDSAYWLYLTHLPLVIVAQAWLRDWDVPATLKFLLICVSVTAILLFTYQLLVRDWWLGRLLNGPSARSRPSTVSSQ